MGGNITPEIYNGFDSEKQLEQHISSFLPQFHTAKRHVSSTVR